MALPANVNGWRGDTNLDERIHFDLELMMQHAACITLRVPLPGICLVARATYLRLCLRYQLIAEAIYLPKGYLTKPRFRFTFGSQARLAERNGFCAKLAPNALRPAAVP